MLCIELLVGAVISQRTAPGDTIRIGLEAGEHPNLVYQPLPLPRVDATAFVTPTRFVPRLAATTDRYITWAPPAASFEKGYLFMQLEPDWPALAMERGTLFGAHDALGYNPVQLRRYWEYIRVRTPLPVFYNASVIDVPMLRDVRLLGARYLVVPTGITPPLATSLVDRGDGYDLRRGARLAAADLGRAQRPSRADSDRRPADDPAADVRSRSAGRRRAGSGLRTGSRGGARRSDLP